MQMSEKRCKLKARTDIGQHFMINTKILDLISELVPKKNKVIEIGAGLGQMTEKLAARTEKLIAVEIDERFFDRLHTVAEKNKNIEIMIGNVLKLNNNVFDDAWVVGNIPYHITEPLMSKMIKTRIKGMVLLVGSSFAKEALAIESNIDDFGKLSMLVNTFYIATVVCSVGKENFDPQPRTESTIIRFVPRNDGIYREDVKMFLMKRLFMTSNHSPLIKSVLREGLIKYNDMKMTKNEARDMIASFKIPESILNKPFEQLNNNEYGVVNDAL